MSFRCDRCNRDMQYWRVSFNMSMDYDPSEPDKPPEAGDNRGHLCDDCRADFRDFINRGDA